MCQTCERMNIPDKKLNKIHRIFPPYSLQEQPTRKEHILSKLISSIIVHCPRANYHNYLPGGAKSPRRILTRACPESALQNLENFISARARNTRLEVRVSLHAYYCVSNSSTKEEEHRHSTIRATSLPVKFDAKIQDARETPYSFAVLCAKKKMTRTIHESRRSLIVINWQDVERLLCLHIPGDNRGISGSRVNPPFSPYSHLASARSPSAVFVHIESITHFLPAFTLPPVSLR